MSVDPLDAPPIAYTVVVGVSAATGSPAALRWAVGAARPHHGRVLAVQAWRPPRPPATVGAKPPVVSVDAQQSFDDAAEQLAFDVTKALGPDSGVEPLVLKGSRRKVLLAASAQADLLVLDAPRRSNAPSLARRLIHRANCPVVVMPTAP